MDKNVFDKVGDNGFFSMKMFSNYAKIWTVLRIYDEVQQRDKDSASILTGQDGAVCVASAFLQEKDLLHLKMLQLRAKMGNNYHF